MRKASGLHRKERPAGRKIRTAGPLLSILGWIGKILGTMLLIFLTTGAMLGCIFAIYVDRYVNTGLDINPADFQLDLTSFIYYLDKETGEYKVLEELHASENRVWASYEEIPQYVFDALIAIEDKRFPLHKGVDWYRTTSAFLNMFLGMRDNFGGSTITQQLIKNLTDENEVTVRRKITEIFRALEFERNYSKEDILEWYLNLVYFSQGAYGIKAASKVYFDKDVSELTLAEAAAIIGITNLPTTYDPYINRENNKKRQELILHEMCRQGYISEKERDAAIAEKLVFRRDSRISSGEANAQPKYQSYFVDQVIDDVIDDLVEQKGISRKIATQLLYGGGYHIYTTLDMDIQSAIDEVFTNPEYWPELKETDGEAPQAAIVVMDPYTGDIAGMYGGLGEKPGNLSWNRATMSQRQPGSSIKPIAVYAPAIEAGLVTPYSVRTDMPVEVLNKTTPWPKNYDVRTVGFRGQVTVMKAVEQSINTVAAQLAKEMTPDRCFEFAKYKMGLSSLIDEITIRDKKYSDIHVSSMALGGLTRGVTVRELTEAYSIFPNRGVYNHSRTYTKVVDSNGVIVLENKLNSTPVIKEKTAFYMNQMLQNVVTNGTGINARLSNMPSAGKTGTTDDDYDRWYAGYTSYYTAVVWYGFDQNKTIVTKSGTSPAVPLWKAVMEKIHENLEPREFFTPSGTLVKASYCLDSGKAAGPACRADIRGSRVATGTFFNEDVPTEVCDVHKYVYIDSETRQLATPYCPAERLERVAMLDLDRRFPVSGVKLNDEVYTIRDYENPEAISSDGTFRVGMNLKKDQIQHNAFCHEHPEPPPSPSPSEEPGDPWDFWDDFFPDIPSASPDPGDDGDGGQGGPETPPADPGENDEDPGTGLTTSPNGGSHPPPGTGEEEPEIGDPASTGIG
jgi:penicillin-binding protein 1A